MSLYDDILPKVNKLWPPDNRVTNMDVVFFGHLENSKTGPMPWEPGETWVQKGHPEVFWPKQWLSEDLSSNVQIFEIRYLCSEWPVEVPDHNFEEKVMKRLKTVATESLAFLQREMSKLYGNGQSRPLVFVGHGYGALVLKQTLINPHSDFSKKLLCNLCGIVFYGAVLHLKTHSTNLKPTEHTKMLDSSQSIEAPLKLITEVLLESSECFEAAVDLSEIKVCIVNQGNSNIQEIQNYADLEHKYTSIMDKNDFSTPISKEDPIYVMFLKFLQQVIDDMKSQKVQLKPWEATSIDQAKEALAKVGIGSSSTRGKRHKNLDQLQHAAEQNVDKVTDRLSQEARMLRMLLHRKIHEAKNHGSSTTFPDLHELHSKFLDDTSMLLGARQNAEVESVQFLFLDAQCMSKVVGVGVQHALVTVTNDNDVKVEHLSESTWESSLDSMFKDVKDQGDFELIGFELPKMKVKSIKTKRLPAKQVKKFGVNLKDFRQDHIITTEQSKMLFPLIWVVELYRAFRRPEQASVGGSATDALSSGGSEVGNSQGDGDGEDDGEGGGSDPPEENQPRFVELLQRKVIHKFKVTIYPGLGGSFQGVHPIPEHMRTASIMSTLIVEFSQENTGAKFIHVTTQTQCNLGRNGNSRNYFGCFQDDVTISFGESDPAIGGTELLFFAASDLRENDGVLTTDTTSQTVVETGSSSNQVSTNSSGQLLIAGSGGQVQNREDRTSSQERSFSRAHTQEIPNIQQIDGFNVHQRNFGNELIYNFCIPPVIRNSNNPVRILRYRDTFTPKVVGKWSVPMQSDLDLAPFTFKVERLLFPIESGEVNFGTGRVQDYKLSMLINLTMSHLDALDPLDAVEGIELRWPTLGQEGVIHVFRHWG